jgi:hypothetical protein
MMTTMMMMTTTTTMMMMMMMMTADHAHAPAADILAAGHLLARRRARVLTVPTCRSHSSTRWSFQPRVRPPSAPMPASGPPMPAGWLLSTSSARERAHQWPSHRDLERWWVAGGMALAAMPDAEAQTRLDEIRSSLVLEANGVHTAMLLVRTMDADNAVHKTRTLLLFASYRLRHIIVRTTGILSWLRLTTLLRAGPLNDVPVTEQVHRTALERGGRAPDAVGRGAPAGGSKLDRDCVRGGALPGQDCR